MTPNQPVHPGRILRETLIPEAGITVAEAALPLGESDQTLKSILAEQTSLTAALCLKIAKLFDSSPELWLRLQTRYDLHLATHDESLARSLERIVPALPRSRVMS
jgi:addiction module HigA family antidote